MISKKCHYALRAVFELAVRKGNGPVKIHYIADAQGIPTRFLEVILNQLKHGDFVTSYRGQDGGYELARPANEISVGEVVSFVQGLPEPLERTLSKDQDRVRGDYAFEGLWRNVSEAIHGILEHTTIADLIESEESQSKGSLNYAI